MVILGVGVLMLLNVRSRRHVFPQMVRVLNFIIKYKRFTFIKPFKMVFGHIQRLALIILIYNLYLLDVAKI